MIDRDTVARLAKVHSVKPFQEEKTYIQSLILRSIYLRVARDLVFKGGTALYLFNGLNRFSEDLDFTLAKPKKVDEVINETLKDLQIIGVRGMVKPLSNVRDSISFKFSCEGPLYTTEVSRVTVKVEISTREKTLLEPDLLTLDPVYPDILPFTCPVMNRREIQSEKVRAILTRNKARDLYDLWFLFKRSNGEFCNLGMINSKLSYYSTEYHHPDFIEAMEEKRSFWRSELNPVMIGKIPEVDIVVKEVSEFMGSIVSKNST
ncbi:MAG: nucleotidyl transferase AbiEii/AbiGii toxin family protein [Thermoplasmataceae archaeon]